MADSKKTNTEKSLDEKEAKSEGTQARERLAKQDAETKDAVKGPDGEPVGGTTTGSTSGEVAADETDDPDSDINDPNVTAVEGEDQRAIPLHRSGAVATGASADVRVPGHADIIWGSPAMPEEVRKLYDEAEGQVDKYVELAQREFNKLKSDIKSELKEQDSEAKKENKRVEKEQKKNAEEAKAQREKDAKSTSEDQQARIRASDATTGADDPRKERVS